MMMTVTVIAIVTVTAMVNVTVTVDMHVVYDVNPALTALIRSTDLIELVQSTELSD